MRFLARFVGLWLLAAALVFAVIDGARSIAGSEMSLTPLGATWSGTAPASLESVEMFFTERLGADWFWEGPAQSVLAVPTWGVLAILGLFLVLVGRPRSRGDELELGEPEAH